MLIDSVHLPLLKKANSGDTIAQVKTAGVFYHGKGTRVNYAEAKKYLVSLAESEPEEIPEIGYGTLLYFIGETCYNLKQMQEANMWYRRSLDYFREVYIEDFANELIEDFHLEDLIKKTGTYLTD